jgi:hypothetical protein
VLGSSRLTPEVSNAVSKSSSTRSMTDLCTSVDAIACVLYLRLRDLLLVESCAWLSRLDC